MRESITRTARERMDATPEWIPQAAAIPIRKGQVCLVTSRSGKRWVLPKGCIEPGKTAGEIALQEAWEEAGLVGVLDPHPIGSYCYDKYGSTYQVTVFVLKVTTVARDWPERMVRQREWFSAAEATERVEELGLCQLLQAALAGRENASLGKSRRPAS